MIRTEELKRYVEDAVRSGVEWVAIDDDGICLVDAKHPHSTSFYLEIGGTPEDGDADERFEERSGSQ